MVCLCGEMVDGSTWEETGAALDAHLEQVKDRS
jgi:hypothetical protein